MMAPSAASQPRMPWGRETSIETDHTNDNTKKGGGNTTMKPGYSLVVCLLALVLFSPGYSHAVARFGEDIVIEKGETEREAFCFGGDIIIRGTLRKNAFSFGADVIVECGGKVMGDAISFGGDVRVRDGGTVHNNAVSMGGDVRVDPGGVVKGKRKEKERGFLPSLVRPPGFDHIGRFFARNILLGPFVGIFGAAGALIGAAFLMVRLVVAFAVAAFITLLFPRSVDAMAGYANDGFPRALLIGLMFLVLLPFLALALVISLLGIPLVPLLMLFVFVAYLFGSVGLALWVGRLIPESEGRTQMVNVLLGVLVIGVVKHIPVVGFVVGTSFFIASLGLVLITRFGSQPQRI